MQEYRLLSQKQKISKPDNDVILDRFLEYINDIGLTLYATQEEAILALFEEKNVILHTPTGSGKSLVATALHFKALCQNKRSVYTSPIKALVNEKFLALCREFGPDQVGMATGDATINKDASILCCTAEILSNIALRHGELAPYQDVIMDEFHYYSDKERGVAWQVPLLSMPRARFLLMSATLGDTSFFEEALTKLNSLPTVVVKSETRPVPLVYEYSENTLTETVLNLVNQKREPIYIVHFSQLEAAQTAQDFLSFSFCSREEKQRLDAEIKGFSFSSPYGPEIKKLLKNGIGLHHAGLLPKYRVLVEKLAQKGLLKIICGTDTLGVGINVPIRTVLFTRLCKFNGEKTTILSAREFHQISGRAGRKGFDNQGWVVVQAPEHVIENLKMEQKAGGDPTKLRKVVKKKPPEKNFVSWDKATFNRLVSMPPERLVSRFQVTHGMLLNVLSRGESGCAAMRKLIRDCHESPSRKKQLLHHAFKLFRSLLERKIIEFEQDVEGKHKLRLNIELQDDFSLDQTLSLYLIDTIKALDTSAPDYVLDLISIVESILEDPEIILHRQLYKIKSEKIAEMKRQGLDYDQRMIELENLEYPKPKADFIYSTFNEFAKKHPWLAKESIRPKSIAREMYENFYTFEDYIRIYELQKVEGVLLRYLTDVYKTISQTVPAQFMTEQTLEMEEFFKAIVKTTDSSLIDEWEMLKHPALQIEPLDKNKIEQAPGQARLIDDERSLFTLIRNEVFVLLKLLATGQFDKAAERIAPPTQDVDTVWTAENLESIMREYNQINGRMLFDPSARNSANTLIEKSKDNKVWRVEQVLIDINGNNDWSARFFVVLSEIELLGRTVLHLEKIGPIGL